MKRFMVRVTTQDDDNKYELQFKTRHEAESYYDGLREVTTDNIKLIHNATLFIDGIGMSSFCHLDKKRATEYLRDLIGDMQRNRRWDSFSHLIYEEYARESSSWLTPTMWTTLVTTWLAFDLGTTVRDGMERVFVPCTKFCPKGR